MCILKCNSKSQVQFWIAKDLKTNFVKKEIKVLQRVCKRLENITEVKRQRKQQYSKSSVKGLQMTKSSINNSLSSKMSCCVSLSFLSDLSQRLKVLILFLVQLSFKF